MVNPNASQVGKQNLKLQDQEEAHKNMCDVLEDVFADKSDSTLATTACAPLMYVRWV